MGGQSIPAGWLVTFVEELLVVTVSGWSPACGELCPNAAAVSAEGLSKRTVQGPVPAAAQGPSQAANRPPAPETGVSVISDP